MTNEQIAAEWRGEVVSAIPWRRATQQNDLGRGVLCGYAVVAAGFPRRGFLKPGMRLPDADRKCWAAREKIAADLAYEIGLPIPPAVLWRHTGRSSDIETRVVISLIGHPELLDWASVSYLGERPPAMSEASVRSAFAECSGVLAFDTWLDQHEHAAAHPGNLVWGFSSAEDSQITFLDYASALGGDGSWTGDGWRDVVVPGFQPQLLLALDPGRLWRTVEEIESLPMGMIGEIVMRIPEDFLPHAERVMLQKALTERRGLVRETLERHLRYKEPIS